VSHGRKRKKRRKGQAAWVVCAGCLAPQDAAPATLLSGVAAALNACTDAGMAVRLRHGIVEAREGYVLPLMNDRWTARTRTYDPLIVPSAADDDD
jgi:hypothetical protein